MNNNPRDRVLDLIEEEGSHMSLGKYLSFLECLYEDVEMKIEIARDEIRMNNKGGSHAKNAKSNRP